MKVFLTGDRSLPDDAAKLLAASAIATLVVETDDDEFLDIWTGDNDGFEKGVRNFIGKLGDLPQIIATQLNDSGVKDWDRRHGELDFMDLVVFVHLDPLASKIGASLVKTVPSEKLRVVTPA